MGVKAIGPNFTKELEAAGLLGLSFSWGPDGTLQFDPGLSPQNVAAITSVYTAHDPATIPIEQTRLQGIRDDAMRQQLLTQLSTATNLQISQFVDNQVSDLASAKTMLKRILLLLAAR